MNRITEVKGKRIYSGTDYIGKAKDVLINPRDGKIEYLLKGKPSRLLGKEKKEAKRFIKENFIPFDRVKAVRDIIILEGEK